jgi:hypothetical protein
LLPNSAHKSTKKGTKENRGTKKIKKTVEKLGAWWVILSVLLP